MRTTKYSIARLLLISPLLILCSAKLKMVRFVFYDGDAIHHFTLVMTAPADAVAKLRNLESAVWRNLNLPDCRQKHGPVVLVRFEHTAVVYVFIIDHRYLYWLYSTSYDKQENCIISQGYQHDKTYNCRRAIQQRSV